jgi:hypothetical protein
MLWKGASRSQNVLGVGVRTASSGGGGGSSSGTGGTTFTGDERRAVKANRRALKKRIMPSIDAAAAELFRQLDLDQDGRITFSEWAAGAQSNKMLQRWCQVMSGSIAGTSEFKAGRKDSEVLIDDILDGIADSGSTIAGVMPQEEL